MALDFNGTSDALDPGDDTFIDLTTLSGTVAAWVLADTLSTATFHHAVIGRGRGGTSGWKLGAGGSNVVGRLVFSKKGVADLSTAGVTVPTGSWVFIGAVVQATQVTLFVITAAGVETVANVANAVAMDNTPTATETRIGCDLSSTGTNTDWWDGKIKHIYVLPGVQLLTAAERKALAFGGSAALGRNPGGYWPLHALATPEADLSGNAKNATVSGAIAAVVFPPSQQYVPDMVQAA